MLLDSDVKAKWISVTTVWSNIIFLYSEKNNVKQCI